MRDVSRIFAKVYTDCETERIACDGEDGPVYLLIPHPRKMALSKLVNSLGEISSRLLCAARSEFTGRYLKGVLGSPAYFSASRSGVPFSMVAKYVNSQREAAKSCSLIPSRPEQQDTQRGLR